MFFYSRRKSCGFRNAISFQVMLCSPLFKLVDIRTLRAHLSLRKCRVQERGQEAWSHETQACEDSIAFRRLQTPKTALTCAYMCVFMCMFMCVPSILAISGHLSEPCFYFAYYCPFIFEVQMIYQVRENRDKGEGRLHS